MPPVDVIQKYAVAFVMDQTIGYVDTDGDATTEHPKVRLFDVRGEAELGVAFYNSFLRKPEYVERWGAWIEDVIDEAEFRAREDTW